jgi:hypothetical protein
VAGRPLRVAGTGRFVRVGGASAWQGPYARGKANADDQRREEKKRAAGVVWVRRLVLASRGLTGLLNPCVKSGTKLFQPYFINCFNCAPAGLFISHSANFSPPLARPAGRNLRLSLGAHKKDAPTGSRGIKAVDGWSAL